MYSMTVIELVQFRRGPHSFLECKKIYENFKKYIPEELRDKDEYQYDPERSYIHIPIPRDSDAYMQLLNTAKENHVYSGRYEFTEFTKKEIKEAEYFHLGITTPLESEGTDARDYGTKYKNCCDECCIGGELDGDLLVDRKFMKKRAIGTLKPDVFVSSQVKWLIESNGLTGAKFEHRVRDFKGREMPEYYIMTFEHTMPPMHPRTFFDYDPPAKHCKKCGRVVPYLRAYCCYKKSDFADAKDFNVSYEVFNNYFEPAIIVSKRVKEVFNEYKVNCGFMMLNVLDD